MRNEYIKYLDEYKISDGLVREMLHKEKIQEGIKAIDDAIERRYKQIDVLKELQKNLHNKELLISKGF